VGFRKGAPKTGTDEWKITISDIRDHENSLVPHSALRSIVGRITREMERVGLKAVVKADDG